MTGADPTALERRAVIEQLMESRDDALVVTGLGSPTYDVHAAGDDDRNYHLWGAMGGTAAVGLGLALAQPDRRIIVVTGDGDLLMGLGSLATIGVAAPANLEIWVLDNEHYGETGMQQSHTADGVDLAEVARACGFVDARTVSDATALQSAIGDDRRSSDGPRLVVVKVDASNPPRSLPVRDPVFLKNRMRAQLGLAPN